MLYIGFTQLSMQQISKIFHVKYEDNTSWTDHYHKLKKVVSSSGLTLHYNKKNGLFSFGLGAIVLNHTIISVSETNKYLESLEKDFIEIMSVLNEGISEISPIVFDYYE